MEPSIWTPNMSPKEIFDMIFGTLIAMGIMFYVIAGPIFWYKRRYHYDRTPQKFFKKLLEKEYYDYVSKKTNINISRSQLAEFVEYEHLEFKSRPFQPLIPVLNIFVFVVNSGRKDTVARLLSEKFDYISKKEALKLLRLEDRYLRRFYPWWRKFI